MESCLVATLVTLRPGRSLQNPQQRSDLNPKYLTLSLVSRVMAPRRGKSVFFEPAIAAVNPWTDLFSNIVSTWPMHSWRTWFAQSLYSCSFRHVSETSKTGRYPTKPTASAGAQFTFITCMSHVHHMCTWCKLHVRHMCLVCASHVKHMCFVCGSYVSCMCFACKPADRSGPHFLISCWWPRSPRTDSWAQDIPLLEHSPLHDEVASHILFRIRTSARLKVVALQFSVSTLILSPSPQVIALV